MEKIAFVTGGSGYIGTYLIRQLLVHNYKIIAFDIRFSERFVSEFGERVVRVSGDLQTESLAEALAYYKPTHVYHLAGLKNRTNSIEEFKSSIDVNYKGTLNLFSALVDCEWLQHIIIMGTTEEYGCAQAPFNEDTREIPHSAYGLSKLAATRLALLYNSQFNLPVTVLRPSIAYGPNQGSEMFLPALINTLKEGKEFNMTKGEQLRDFIYIDDLIDCIILSCECNNTIGEILNVAYGESEELGEIARYIASIVGKIDKLKLGAVPYRRFEIMNYSVNTSKIRNMLNWIPKVSIYEGVKKLL